MAATAGQLDRYQKLIDGMTNQQLLHEFALVTRQQAKADFGSDLWEAGLEMIPMLTAAVLARMESK